MTTALETQIKVVAEARKTAEAASNVKVKARLLWEIENKGLIENAMHTGLAVMEAETLLRELTLQVYAETGNKAPAVGVGIREVTILDYDKKVAFDWAKSHKMALQLDKKAFEKIVKADTPDFVTVTHEPQATIATNL